ncbi:MAG: protein kinase [Sulfolobus sp.]
MKIEQINKILAISGLLPIVLLYVTNSFTPFYLIFAFGIIFLTLFSRYDYAGLGIIIGGIASIIYANYPMIKVDLLIPPIIALIFSLAKSKFWPSPILGIVFSLFTSLYFGLPEEYLATILIGLVLSLFTKPKDPSIIFTVAIPYFTFQTIYLIIYSFSTSTTINVLNTFFSLSKFAFLSYATVIIAFILYLKEKDYIIEGYLNFLIGIISIGVSGIIAYLYSSPLSVMYSLSGSAILSFTPSLNDLKTTLITTFKTKDLRLAKRIAEIYKGDLTEIFCQFANEKLCEAVVLLPEFRPFSIDYSKCDYTKVAECFLDLKKVPSRDIVRYLLIVKDKDVNLAEKVGKLAVEVSPSPKLLALMDEIEVLKLDYLKYNWDPQVWLNKTIHDYKITSYLGKGGSAYVMMGEKDDKKYAIKIPILMPPSSYSYTYYDFINEYMQLRELSQKSGNIVKFIDAQIDPVSLKKILSGDVGEYLKNPPILVMEYLEGGSAKTLSQDDNVFYSDEWQDIVKLIGLQIAKALKEIHDAGFVHLDIKPSNILFSKPPGRTGKEVLANLKNGETVVKISDLGSARKIGEKFAQFTPEFCPVDQIEALLKGEGARPSMDIYSLGATMYTLLTRQSFNSKELITLFNDAITIYEQKGDYSAIIEKAKEEYRKYYENLKIEDVREELVNLIKDMVNPDPEKRPKIDEVLERLSKMT